MIYQTTKGIDPAIKKSGCYFLSILRIYEIITGAVLTVDAVNKIFQIASRVGYISATGFIKEDAGKGIAQIASGLLNKHCYIRRVEKDDSYNFIIGKYVHTGTHFILMPDTKNEEYDPWSSSGSNTVKNGKFHSPRYYFAEAI
jgi:hypothetical protein